jgi:2-alkenal reductase
VEFSDLDRIPARIVGWDIYDDVGLIKVDPGDHALAPVPLGTSANVVVGEPVAAIGSPLGNENSLAVGIVSAVHRSIAALTAQQYNLVDAIQTDAPITHGNSGGPLFDARGRVIGINAQIRSSSGSGNDLGIGFAVPIDSAKRSLDQLLRQGHVDYAFVGIRTASLTPSVARKLGYKVRRGAAVELVEPSGPAAKAGMRGGEDTQVLGSPFPRGGDVIVAINGRPVASADDLVRIVSSNLRPGQVATFTVYRDGLHRRTLALTLGKRVAKPSGG